MGGWWMAEVGSKEFFVCEVDVIVRGDNLSFSPLAVWLNT